MPAALCSLKNLEWVGYLSSTSVYGHTGDKEASENFKTNPTTTHGRRRAKAEKDWLHLWSECGLPVHVFRLAAIYGPGRSVIDRLKNGSAQNIIKPGHYFSRIHIDDIVSSLKASMLAPNAGQIYNVCRGESDRIKDILNYLIKRSNKELRVVVKDSYVKKNDIIDSYGDNSKLIKDTRWNFHVGTYEALDKISGFNS